MALTPFWQKIRFKSIHGHSRDKVYVIIYVEIGILVYGNDLTVAGHTDATLKASGIIF